MSETVHHLLADAMDEYVAIVALDVLREHGIKLCRAAYEVHDLVPLADEEIGQ